MKKNILILGAALAAIGIVIIAFAGLPKSAGFEQHSESKDIEVGTYSYWAFDLEKGEKLEFSFSTNDSVDFVVVNSENYEYATGGTGFYTNIYTVEHKSRIIFIRSCDVR